MENKIVSVTQVLQLAGMYDFSMVPNYIMSASQEFGSAVHKACELWDKGTLNVGILSAPLIPYLEGWKKFKIDYKISGFLAIEQELVSTKWGFCGHPDRIYQVNKTMVDIYDIKTAKQVHPATSLQLGGYQILVEENLKLTVRNRWTVLLGEDGPKIKPSKDRTDSYTFLCVLQTVNWQKGYLK